MGNGIGRPIITRVVSRTAFFGLSAPYVSCHPHGNGSVPGSNHLVPRGLFTEGVHAYCADTINRPSFCHHDMRVRPCPSGFALSHFTFPHSLLHSFFHSHGNLDVLTGPAQSIDTSYDLDLLTLGLPSRTLLNCQSSQYRIICISIEERQKYHNSFPSFLARSALNLVKTRSQRGLRFHRGSKEDRLDQRQRPFHPTPLDSCVGPLSNFVRDQQSLLSPERHPRRLERHLPPGYLSMSISCHSRSTPLPSGVGRLNRLTTPCGPRPSDSDPRGESQRWDD